MAKADDGDQLPLNLQGGTNLTKIKKDLLTAHTKLDKIEEQMEALQAQKQAIREDVKAMGVSKKSFDSARRDKKADPEKREENDVSYQIAREALGVPIVPFESPDDKSDKNPKSKPKPTSAAGAATKAAGKASDAAVKKASAKAAKPKPNGKAAPATGSRPLAGLEDAVARAEQTSADRAAGKLN